MENLIAILLGAILITLVAGITLLWAKRHPAESDTQTSIPIDAETLAPPPPVATDQDESMIDAIQIGVDPHHPVIEILPGPSLARFQSAEPLPPEAHKPISKLSNLMQAVPSLLTASEASGKQLMEVVINGDLVRATDGAGLRAFAMDGGRITEHARLFDASSLQTMVNAAAVWQVASVLVAQQHLADISSKLDDIKQEIGNISRFLDNQRRARLQAAYDYLAQVEAALRAGELPEAARIELESCERDLLEIHHHLQYEFEQRLCQPIERTEKFGTKELCNDIAGKIEALNDLTQDMAFCLRVRLAAWHVLALYPGENHLKQSRESQLRQALAKYEAIVPAFRDTIGVEISNVKSMFNREGTLEERRDSLRALRDNGVQAIEYQTASQNLQMAQSEIMFQASDIPMHLLVRVEDGRMTDVRLAA